MLNIFNIVTLVIVSLLLFLLKVYKSSPPKPLVKQTYQSLNEF